MEKINNSPMYRAKMKKLLDLIQEYVILTSKRNKQKRYYPYDKQLVPIE